MELNKLFHLFVVELQKLQNKLVEFCGGPGGGNIPDGIAGAFLVAVMNVDVDPDGACAFFCRCLLRRWRWLRD